MRLLEAVIYNYLVGNNDAHGKNFSLLYHGVGTEKMAIRLAPLYDIVSTVYYPELSRDMAMKIGGEVVGKGDGEELRTVGRRSGAGQAPVRARVPEMAERVIAALGNIEITHPDAEKVAALIRQRSEKNPGRLSELNCCTLPRSVFIKVIAKRGLRHTPGLLRRYAAESLAPGANGMISKRASSQNQ